MIVMTYVARSFSSAIVRVICVLLILGLLHDRGDVAAETTQQGTISGRVVTGVGDVRPVRRAHVFLTRVDGPGSVTEISDDEGRFAFANLPAGRYLLGADKAGFVRMNHGETRPGRPGSAIAIADGQQLTSLTLHMIPGGVITGTVFDQAGNGASEVEVYVFRTRVRSGERMLAETDSVMTDDRGVYRIYGLTPGEYLVAAKPTFRFGAGGARETTVAEFERAISTTRTSGAPAATQPRSRPVGYSAVYYPGTFEWTGARPLTVNAGQERAGIDISLQLITLSSVEGRITWPGNRPGGQRAVVMVVPLAQSPWLHGMEFDTAVADDRTFAFRLVPPGRYAVLAQTVVEGEREGAGIETPPALSAVQDIDVQGDDINGIVLALQPGGSLSGRLVAGGANVPSRLDTSRISLQLRTTTAKVTAMRPANVKINADGTFSIADIMPGSYRLVVRSRPPDQAIVSTAIINGVNVLDDPVDLRAGARFDDVVVTFTDQPTELSGVMLDRAGQPAPEHHVVVFSLHPPHWFRDSRYIQAVRPGNDGRYLVRGLPAGEYFLAALTDIEDGEWFDPGFLEALMPAAIKISLGQGEKKAQDIRIGGR